MTPPSYKNGRQILKCFCLAGVGVGLGWCGVVVEMLSLAGKYLKEREGSRGETYIFEQR